jgi:signal transduction histidine kinase
MSVSSQISVVAVTEARAANSADIVLKSPWTEALAAQTGALADRFLPAECADDPELTRRGRLVIRFGFLGFISGLLFAAFYLFIGHYWGTGIVVLSSLAFLATPFLVRNGRTVHFGGQMLSSIMALGFTAMCLVEGGMYGHAVAWLASVPLCALLLLGRGPARFWVTVCFGAAGVVVALGLTGVDLPTTYPHEWHPVVTAAGYLALIAFMFVLGLFFENGRVQAFNKMEAALAKLATNNDKLVALNNEKNEFLGIAAHDLKNPLSTVIGYAEFLEIISTEKDVLKVAGSIQSAGRQMSDLISNLLDANSIEEGRFTSKLERCDLAQLIFLSADNNRSNATRKNIVLAVEPIESLPAKTDRAATLQILDNLISNAVKYSPKESRVEIKAGFEKGRVFVGVQDYGPGLSEADQKKLFQKFTRLSARPTGGESSNGLGLSIVKRLAEAMDGSVECRSVQGEGATFLLWLPPWTDLVD